MSDHLEAAMEDGGDAIYEKLFAFGLNGNDAREAAEAAITAALPDLEKHFAQDPNVRRAIIQELANEHRRHMYLKSRHTVQDIAVNGWLRAKLKETES